MKEYHVHGGLFPRDIGIATEVQMSPVESQGLGTESLTATLYLEKVKVSSHLATRCDEYWSDEYNTKFRVVAEE